MCRKPLKADKDQIWKQGILQVWTPLTSLSSERTKVRQSSVQKQNLQSKENSLSEDDNHFL